MSKISALLDSILKAVYGRDVRQSIHDSIEQCYTDVTNARTLADNAIEGVRQKAEDCEAAASEARTAAGTATASASAADNAATTANTAAASANAASTACDEAAAALPEQVAETFAELGLTMTNGKLCVKVERG